MDGSQLFDQVDVDSLDGFLRHDFIFMVPIEGDKMDRKYVQFLIDGARSQRMHWYYRDGIQ